MPRWNLARSGQYQNNNNSYGCFKEEVVASKEIRYSKISNFFGCFLITSMTTMGMIKSSVYKQTGECFACKIYFILCNIRHVFITSVGSTGNSHLSVSIPTASTVL